MAHSPGFLALVADVKQRIRECTVDEVAARRARGEEFVLVDVREDHEAARGVAQGAVHLGKGVIERDIEQQVPDKDAEIVLYCGGGFRSALVADNLQKMGYKNVVSMDGGFRAWAERGLPVERPGD